MRKVILPTLMIAACLLWAGNAAHAAHEIRWGNSLKAALAQSKKTGHLVMIDFYTDWCTYCKRMDAETYTDPSVLQAAAQIIPVKLNPERQSEGLAAARKLGVHGFPSVFFVNANGEVEGNIGGYVSAGQFLQTLQGIMQLHRDLPVMQSKLRANPTDLALASRLTAIYASRGNRPQAASTLALVTRLDPKSSRGYLSPSTLAVARMYMDASQFDQALTCLLKVARTSPVPEERGIAHLNAGVCYAEMNKLDMAETEFNNAGAVPNCPPRLKQAAQQLLGRVQQAKSQKH